MWKAAGSKLESDSGFRVFEMEGFLLMRSELSAGSAIQINSEAVILILLMPNPQNVLLPNHFVEFHESCDLAAFALMGLGRPHSQDLVRLGLKMRHRCSLESNPGMMPSLGTDGEK